jgi:uncharacterized protein (UPF0276 family)
MPRKSLRQDLDNARVCAIHIHNTIQQISPLELLTALKELFPTDYELLERAYQIKSSDRRLAALLRDTHEC